jgi:hypothetical protein
LIPYKEKGYKKGDELNKVTSNQIIGKNPIEYQAKQCIEERDSICFQKIQNIGSVTCMNILILVGLIKILQ